VWSPSHSGDCYEGRLISNAHSEIFCRRSKVATRPQGVLVATTLLHSGANFHSFLYTGSKTVPVNMECVMVVCPRAAKRLSYKEDAQCLEVNVSTVQVKFIKHKYM